MFHRKVGNHLTGCINGVTAHVITSFIFIALILSHHVRRTPAASSIIFIGTSSSSFSHQTQSPCVATSYLHGCMDLMNPFHQFLGNMQFRQV